MYCTRIPAYAENVSLMIHRRVASAVTPYANVVPSSRLIVPLGFTEYTTFSSFRFSAPSKGVTLKGSSHFESLVSRKIALIGIVAPYRYDFVLTRSLNVQSGLSPVEGVPMLSPVQTRYNPGGLGAAAIAMTGFRLAYWREALA